MAVDPARAKSLFLGAKDFAGLTERAAYINRECGGDDELRDRVEALLQANESASLNTQAGDSAEALDRPAPTADYEDPSARIGLVVAGRYTLLEKVGEGGMGEVWAARQSEPVKRKVALKLIKKGMDSKAVLARFEQERQALAVMDHPNIARVFDGGLTVQGSPYFVMELVAGLPLNKFCDEGKLSVKDRLEVFVAVCQAVQHAHQKGLVHRDLKPANILVTFVDGKPTPKVIDFGVAKATSGKLTDETLSTQFGAVLGTLEYMSPEQAGQTTQDIDTRADIYSLGVILYELLTGLRPFDSKRLKKAALDEVIRIIKEEEPPSLASRLSTDESLPSVAALRKSGPKQLISQVRGELAWIVHKCLEKDRNRRYETANGLARDLQRYLADEPVEARPATARYRLGKFYRRHRGTVLAAGALALTLLCGVAGTTWGMLRAEAKAKEAMEERDAKDKALAAETKARQAEQRARDQALAALRAMTDEIVESQMARGAKLTEENKAFLKKIIKQYEGFAAITADDVQSRAIKAEGYARVGMLRHRLGDVKEAEAAYGQAAAHYRQLAADDPSSQSYRQWLASSQRNLGLLYGDTGRRKEAERALADALAMRKRLAIDFPDGPGPQQDLAGSHDSMATLLRDVGRLKEAENEYASSLALRKRLAADFPDRIDFARELAQSHNNLGFLYRTTGRPKEAVEAAESALAIRKQLADSDPKRTDFRNDLARSHNNLGVLLNDAGKFAEGAVAYTEARTIFRELAAEFPARPDFRRELARTHTNLASAYADLGRLKEAEAAYGEAVSAFKQLAADYPTLPEYRHNLALSLSNLGLLYTTQERLDESEAAYTEAIAVNKQLVFASPKEPELRHVLANTMTNLAHLCKKRRNFQGARDQVVAAPPHLEAARKANPNNPEYRELTCSLLQLLAHASAALLDQPAALQAAENLRDLPWSPPNNAVYAIRALAGCIPIVQGLLKLAAKEREAAIGFYGDRAMVQLRDALAKGYTNVDQIKLDRELDPLRTREDFTQLMAGLEKKAENK